MPGEDERKFIIKVKELIGNCNPELGEGETVDRRFRAFVKRLDPEDGASQACFQSLYERHSKCPATRQHRTRVLARDLPLPRRTRRQPLQADSPSPDPLRISPTLAAQIPRETLAAMSESRDRLRSRRVEESTLNEASEAWLADYAPEPEDPLLDEISPYLGPSGLISYEGEEERAIAYRRGRIRPRLDRDEIDELWEEGNMRAMMRGRRRLGGHLVDDACINLDGLPDISSVSGAYGNRDTRRDGVVFENHIPSLPPISADSHAIPIRRHSLPSTRFILQRRLREAREGEGERADEAHRVTGRSGSFIDFALDEETLWTGGREGGELPEDGRWDVI